MKKTTKWAIIITFLITAVILTIRAVQAAPVTDKVMIIQIDKNEIKLDSVMVDRINVHSVLDTMKLHPDAIGIWIEHVTPKPVIL